jgi:hypothetical protein
MRHPIYTISNNTLKSDIKKQKRVKTGTFTMSSYRLQEHLEKQSERILQSFAEGHLTLEKNQYKLFAKYINIFARSESEECFKRLQGLADFDIKAYLEDQDKSVWEKIFGKKEKSPKAKTPRQMKKEMKKYVKACRKGDEFSAHDIREDAEMYVTSFLRDEIPLPSKDEILFKEYIHVILYPVYEDSNAEKALKKLRAHDYKVDETPQKSSWLSSLKFPKVKMPTFSMPKISMPSFNMPKFKLPKVTMPSFSISEKTKRIASRTLKIAGLAGVLTFGTIWGANKCSGDDKDSLAQNKTELTATPQDSVAEKDTATYHFTPVSNIKETAAKVTTENARIKELEQHKRHARLDHHIFLLNKRIGKKKMQVMFATINKKVTDGVFSLPDSISSVDYAYALVMYRAYGVECSLQKAMNATDKLSAEENAQIIKDILDAGDTGLGVKKKAEQIRLSQHKGSLEEGYSLYNQLSQKDQHQHNVNLKQYRQAKKMLEKSLAH